ncbi:MAG: hypothetical protein LUD07_02395 [Clostridiales bacterium]|nr:hypothetical protein [Clostridiales bacterium]
MSDPFSDIQQQHNQLRMFALAPVVCLVLAIPLVFFNIKAAFLAIALAALIHLLVFKPQARKYESAVNQACLQATICRMLGADSVSESGGTYFSEQTITDSDLMPPPANHTRPLFCWQIQGKRKGLSVSLCDATILHKYSNLSGKERVHYSSGVWTHIRLPKDSGRHFLIVDEAAIPAAIWDTHISQKPEYRRVSIDDPELAERLAFYPSAGDEAQTLSDSFQQSLKRLVNYTPGYVAVSVRGAQMDIFINGRFLSRKIKVSQEIRQNDLQFDPFPELSYLTTLAATLS